MKKFGLISWFVLCSFTWATQPNIIYLMRHAEKTEDTQNPSLSGKGQFRAQNLARLFEHVSFDAIYASQYKRTQQTAQPLANQQKLKVQIYDASTPMPLVRTIREAQSKTFFIVGHSNTIPELIQLLGGPKSLTIHHEEYGSLFLLVLQEDHCLVHRLQIPPTTPGAL